MPRTSEMPPLWYKHPTTHKAPVETPYKRLTYKAPKTTPKRVQPKGPCPHAPRRVYAPAYKRARAPVRVIKAKIQASGGTLRAYTKVMAQRIQASWQEAQAQTTEAEYKSFRPQVIKGKGKPGITRSYSPADIRKQIERELVRIDSPDGLTALRTYNAGVGLASDYPSDFPEFRPTLTTRSSQGLSLSDSRTGQDTELIQALYSQHNLQAFCLLARCLAELTSQEIARSYTTAGYAALWGLYKRRNGIVWE